MKGNTFTVMKKELARFFGDKRMVFATVLMPGILIYMLYSFMGSAMSDKFSVTEDFVPSVSVVNLPSSIEALADEGMIEFTEISLNEAEAVKQEIAQKEKDLLVVFPENFDATVAGYTPQSAELAPNVEIYYNAIETDSSVAYSAMCALLDGYESSMSNKFDINRGEEITSNLASDEDASGSMFSSMLPMLIMIFLFSGCMAVAPEAIAGEKERGTIATLLVTPTKRHELVMGKVGALAIIALLSGASSTLGTMLALPKLMGGAETVSAAIYSASDYALLTVVILSTVLLLISFISIISAFAKSIKEAQTLVMPLMIVVMLIGVTGFFGDGAKTELYWYCVPIYNSVQSMIGIFSLEANSTNVLVTVASNLVFAGGATFVLTKMFGSEKVMFKK